MLGRARWNGLFMLEFLRDTPGRLWFMELNGRVWGSMALARRTGFDYPAWAVAGTFDETCVAPAPVATGPVTCRHLGREIVRLLFALRGKTGPCPGQGPSRTQAVRAVLRVRRSDHWYNWRPTEPALFLEDALFTVCSAVRGRGRR
jgi:hypothetical protein